MGSECMPRRSAQPQAKKPSSRKDPDRRRRHVARVTAGAALENKVEGWHYVWCNPGDAFSGLQSYLARGYEVQTYDSGGVKPVGVTLGRNGAKPGDDITWMDQVLVGIDGDAHEEDVEYGPYGDTGQAKWDEIEAILFDKGNDARLRKTHELGSEGAGKMNIEADAEHGFGG